MAKKNPKSRLWNAKENRWCHVQCGMGVNGGMGVVPYLRKQDSAGKRIFYMPEEVEHLSDEQRKALSVAPSATATPISTALRDMYARATESERKILHEQFGFSMPQVPAPAIPRQDAPPAPMPERKR